MIKYLLPFLILSSCSPSPQMSERISDEYVLVEFASKLEEDYEKNGGVVVTAP